MKINQTTFVPQDTQLKVKSEVKKETEQKDLVSIGTKEETPDFLKQPPISAKEGCAKAGGALGATVGLIGGGFVGTVDALIGMLAQKFGGEVGGLVASGVIGALHFVKGMNAEEPKAEDAMQAKIMKAASGGVGNKFANATLSGVEGAVSTYLGARFGAAGLFYGGLATGVPTSITAGIAMAKAGKVAGEMMQTAADAAGELQKAAE